MGLNNSKIVLWFLVGNLILTFSGSVYAYIGPGGALSGIGSLLALIAAILLAILGFLWFPIKRLIAKIRNTKDLVKIQKQNAQDKTQHNKKDQK